MKILKTVGDLISPNDPELVEKTLARLAEQDTWNDVFSTKLIELLDNIDRVKREIRERIRLADLRIAKAESVSEAEASLLQTAAKFGNACQHLDAAHAIQKEATSAAADAKSHWERATVALDQARDLANETTIEAKDAIAKLNSAKGCYAHALRLSRLIILYATLAVAASWIVMGWVGWFVLRSSTSFAAAIALTVILLAIVIFVARGVRR